MLAGRLNVSTGKPGIMMSSKYRREFTIVYSRNIKLNKVDEFKYMGVSVAYPGGFSGCPETPPGHDFF